MKNRHNKIFTVHVPEIIIRSNWVSEKCIRLAICWWCEYEGNKTNPHHYRSTPNTSICETLREYNPLQPNAKTEVKFNKYLLWYYYYRILNFSLFSCRNKYMHLIIYLWLHPKVTIKIDRCTSFAGFDLNFFAFSRKQILCQLYKSCTNRQ
jgi:hypothetical protein